jgi:hypothetical protein
MTRLYKGQAKSCKSLEHCMSADDKNALKEALSKVEN